MTDPGVHDPERAEEYAESVPVDPTPDEIDRYAELSGEGEDMSALAEPADPSADPSAGSSAREGGR